MLALLFALALFVPAVATAQSTGGHPLTREDLEPFFDGLINAQLTRYNIAGAVVAVVKDGQVLLAKGYGYSNVAARTPVSPDSTLFRVASISKTFNATAVMQLVEQGKLDLDKDIQTYLDFPLPKKFPEPITLRHLLTHTAGFEESAKQLEDKAGTSVELRDHIRLTTPHQIYHPGTVTAYSNYGADLAGYIVERVSGMPFEEYVRTHIFVPLGMLHSSFAEPLPPDLKRLVSKEYTLATDSVKEFEVLQGEPSGNCSSTARDMTRFMIAHLQLGRLDNVRILAESTARYMATTQFRTHPAVNGMAVGFFEESRDGHRMIGHGGDLSRFHSHMTLLMDDGVGLFISVNSSGSSGGFYGIRDVVIDGFMHRYFPRTTPLEPVVTDAKAMSARVAGPYVLSRKGETTIYRIAMLTLPIQVEANEDGSIQVPLLTGGNGQPTRWYAIAPMVYRSEDGSQKLGFVTDSGGNVTRVGFLGGHEFHRASRADSTRFNYWLIGLALAVMGGTLLLWPVAGLVRRRFRQPLPKDGLSPRLRGITRLVPLLSFGLLGGYFYYFSLALGDKLKTDSSMDPWLRFFEVLAALVVLGAVAVVVAAVKSLQGGNNRWSQVKYVALAVACIAFSWFLVHWNVLTTNVDF